ncbi:unnamed protein product [Phyllotreta striolata]|uniref:Uncharacterized protein n=1 Tax=Phyllotreta striolata TaxID=444603 RepID=A0A9N9XTD9_PHYSR|nr:unnamed protein product [Phyllotreta striolata]
MFEKVLEEDPDIVEETPEKQYKFLPQQQDYLKQRYAEQQKIDVQETGKLMRSKQAEKSGDFPLDQEKFSGSYDWQAFSPSNRRIGTNRNHKEYVPLVLDSQKSKKSGSKVSKTIQETSKSDKLSSHIIYLDPRILEKVYKLKQTQSNKQIKTRSIVIEPAQLVQSNSLQDLLNRNPHFQIDQLKRILQDPGKVYPTVQGPQPFQSKAPSPPPKVQAEPSEDPSVAFQIPQNGRVITKEAFERIQKQLEASSSFQVQNALERAQEAARAHVEAQHKAIEQAQRAILENVQKQLQHASPESLGYVLQAPQAAEVSQAPRIPQVIHSTQAPHAAQALQAPQPLRLVIDGQSIPPKEGSRVEETSPGSLRYVQKVTERPAQELLGPENLPQPLGLVRENLQQYVSNIKPVYPTPVPEREVSKVHEVTISGTKPTNLPEFITNTILPEKRYKNVKIVEVKPLQKQLLAQQQPKIVQRPPERDTTAGKIEHYAPNHLHQAAAQLQAERILLQQVQQHNNAIMGGRKAPNRHVGQKTGDDKDVQETQKAYRQVLLDQKSKQRDESYDEYDDVSKNGLIYRVKRNSNFSFDDAYEEYYEYYDDDDNSTDKGKVSNGFEYVEYYEYYDDDDNVTSLVLKIDDDKPKSEKLRSSYAKYAFGYRIKDNQGGGDFGHQEKRSGRSAEGSYEVLLPDGRRQKVEYYADDTGYHAKVSYEKVA